jgi:hypothetical protein
MVMSRREFLGCTAGAMTVAFPIVGLPGSEHAVVTVLDLEEQCSLRESLAGYERASAGAAPRWPVLIVPAAMALPVMATREISACLRRGGTALIESGAGFAGESGFRGHRDALRRLQVYVAAPRGKSRDVPYIDYVWPYPTKIRDFSRVVPLANHQSADVIAWADGLPVASKRRVGAGTLIYLGSPLGQSLWAGDAEAKRWLYAIALSDLAITPTPPASSASMTSVSNSDVAAK